MLESRSEKLDEEIDGNDIIELFSNRILTSGEITFTKDFKATLENMLSGDCIIYVY
jgi:hypothetical protein